MADTVTLTPDAAKTALAAVRWVLKVNSLIRAADRERCEAAAAELEREPAWAATAELVLERGG